MGSDFVQGVEPDGMSVAKSGTFLFIDGLFRRFESAFFGVFLGKLFLYSIMYEFESFLIRNLDILAVDPRVRK